MESSSLCLEDDGYYWHLFPVFEKVWERAGQMIDLYGVADFGPKELPVLREALLDSCEELGKQPERWKVKTGEQIKPVQKTLYDEVDREKFLAFLDSIQSVIQKAIDTKRHLIFFGD